MTNSYRLTQLRRSGNVLMRLLLRLGLAPHTTMLLTVPGRCNGALLFQSTTRPVHGDAIASSTTIDIAIRAGMSSDPMVALRVPRLPLETRLISCFYQQVVVRLLQPEI